MGRKKKSGSQRQKSYESGEQCADQPITSCSSKSKISCLQDSRHQCIEPVVSQKSQHELSNETRSVKSSYDDIVECKGKAFLSKDSNSSSYSLASDDFERALKTCVEESKHDDKDTVLKQVDSIQLNEVKSQFNIKAMTQEDENCSSDTSEIKLQAQIKKKEMKAQISSNGKDVHFLPDKKNFTVSSIEETKEQNDILNPVCDNTEQVKDKKRRKRRPKSSLNKNINSIEHEEVVQEENYLDKTLPREKASMELSDSKHEMKETHENSVSSNALTSCTRGGRKRHQKKSKCHNKAANKQSSLINFDQGNEIQNNLDSELPKIKAEASDKKTFPLRNLSEELTISNHSRDQKIHSQLRKKLLERAEEKLRKEIATTNISSSEKSQRYLEQLTNQLKLLTGARVVPDLITESGHPQLQNNSLPIETEEEGEDDDDFEYKIVQRVVFQPYACHVCKKLTAKDGTELKRCMQCKMISYCCKEHQKDHWQQHRDLCKAICTISKREGWSHMLDKALGLSPEDYRHYRIRCIDACVVELGRDLELWEREMFYYAQVCHTCYACDRSKLTICEKCHNVCYCKPEHLKDNHQTWCKYFKLYADITRYQAQFGMIQPELPNYISTEYRPLPENMQVLISEIVQLSHFPDPLHYAVLTDIATCPLTVLYALQSCYASLSNMSSLIIHMVGAEVHFEADTMKKWEVFILHFLHNQVNLKIVFVGPELKVDMVPKELLNEINVCKKCTLAGQHIEYSFVPGVLYHDYIKSETYSRPDLICALNAGLYRTTGFEGKDTWAPTIQAMIGEPYAPVVITAYTADELPLDVRRMQEYGTIKNILPPTENPFSSSKPSLNFVTEEKVPLIFKNFYIAIVQGLESKVN